MPSADHQASRASGEQLDRVAIADIIARERAARDTGDWDGLARCYVPDSLIDISWFTGTGAEFARASAGMAEKMFSFHELGLSIIDVRGDRALGDTGCTIHLIGAMDGVEVDVVGYIRRGSESALFGLHKARGNRRPVRAGFRWEGCLAGGGEPPRVKPAGAEAVPGPAG